MARQREFEIPKTVQLEKLPIVIAPNKEHLLNVDVLCKEHHTKVTPCGILLALYRAIAKMQEQGRMEQTELFERNSDGNRGDILQSETYRTIGTPAHFERIGSFVIPDEV